MELGPIKISVSCSFHSEALPLPFSEVETAQPTSIDGTSALRHL